MAFLDYFFCFTYSQEVFTDMHDARVWFLSKRTISVKV